MDQPAAAKAGLIPWTPEYEDALEALLIDRFKLTPSEIDRLTEREVWRKYLHRRDRNRDIMFPEGSRPPLTSPVGPASPEKQLEAVALLKATLGDMLRPGAVEEAERMIRERAQQPRGD
jgi:hypothetical protein